MRSNLKKNREKNWLNTIACWRPLTAYSAMQRLLILPGWCVFENTLTSSDFWQVLHRTTDCFTWLLGCRGIMMWCVTVACHVVVEKRAENRRHARRRERKREEFVCLSAYVDNFKEIVWKANIFSVFFSTVNPGYVLRFITNWSVDLSLISFGVFLYLFISVWRLPDSPSYSIC